MCIGLSHYFDVKMGCGKVTNTRVELLALWGLSGIAHRMGLLAMDFFGDSMTTMNWATLK